MRITVLASSYPRFAGDGAAPFVRSICEALAKAGHDIEVVAPYDPLVKPAEQGSLSVHRFRYIWPDRWSIMGHARSLEADVRLRPFSILLLPLFLISAFFTLLTVARRQHAQAVYIHWVIPNGPAGALAARLLGIPYMISLHGSDIFLAQKNRLFGAVARLVFKSATAVTACSPELHAAALSLGAPADTRLLAWGADPVLFTPARRSLNLHASLHLPDNLLLILAIGRMVYKKGFDILLHALPAVIAACPDIHLILAGDGSIRPELEHLAASLGIQDRVTFTGRIPWDQVPTLLASADIFALPSIRDPGGNLDGLPTVLPEAMASATAVIASDIGGVSLVISPGETGLLVPPGDIEALSNALITLISSEAERKRLGAAARQAVIERFNWDQVAGEISTMLARSIQS